MAISHGCGEIDEGYCFSIPPVGLLEIQFEGGRLTERTNRWVDHDTTDKDCDDVGSQG